MPKRPATHGRWSILLDLLVAALLLAGVYAAMSVGMTVIYGVMKIVNLAHAGFLMLGAYFAMELFDRFHLDPILGRARRVSHHGDRGHVRALVAGALAAAVRPATLASLLLMFGFWLVLQNLGT